MRERRMTAHEIRKAFLDFFAARGHRIVPSDSLVPKDDPTVLFTTAGMQQFKLRFLGHIEGYRRAASSQKCLRTDDLDQVGVTSFHHTFFEMLGNFSFGDYFKREAITWAWEFLTKVLGLPEDRLWVSVHHEDREAEEVWANEVGLPPDRIVRLGDKSNFWPSEAREKGPNGPCGPCSEIFYDYGPNPECRNPRCDPDCSCGRFSEVWNLVFTQFNRQEGGRLDPLPSKNIDTGMGLERLTAVVQGVTNNFDTDLFAPVLARIDEMASSRGIRIDLRDRRRLADHMRAAVFAIGDGIVPSNKERGAVVKRLITDAANILMEGGGDAPLAHRLVEPVVESMAPAYPEIREKVPEIVDWIRRTEEAFLRVRRTRIPELEAMDFTGMSDDEVGRVCFIYRDTYGLPLETVLAVARRKGLTESRSARAREIFDGYMERQRRRSREGSKMAGEVFTDTEWNLDLPKTVFLGYETCSAEGRILRIFRGTEEVPVVEAGEDVTLVLDRTPFYAESGGQVGDTGSMQGREGRFEVRDTRRIADVFLHSGVVVEGRLAAGETVAAGVDESRRRAVMRNHTATHLLQAALRRVLGPHVRQQGSLVDAERLRFDFTHPRGLSPEEVRSVEDEVYRRIFDCDAVRKEVLPIDEARRRGALAFFAEKYGEEVRVVSIGDYSREFCGGTHLERTGEIGMFRIVSEGAIAQGIRRIEARTGFGALAVAREDADRLRRIAGLVKTTPADLEERVACLLKRQKALEKDLERLRFDAAKASLDEVVRGIRTIGGIPCLLQIFHDLDAATLRRMVDLIRQKAPETLVIAAADRGAEAALVVAAPESLIRRGMGADAVLRGLTGAIGGRGGGRPRLAQAGGIDPKSLKRLSEVLHKVLPACAGT